MASSLPWATRAESKGGYMMEGARSSATGLVAYLGGPRLCLLRHVKHVNPGSQGFVTDELVIWMGPIGKTSWLVLDKP